MNKPSESLDLESTEKEKARPAKKQLQFQLKIAS